MSNCVGGAAHVLHMSATHIAKQDSEITARAYLKIFHRVLIEQDQLSVLQRSH